MKKLKLLGWCLALAFCGTSCAPPRETSGQDANGSGASNRAASTKSGGVNVPRNMKNAVRYNDIYDERSAIATLPNNSDVLYRRDAQKLSMDELGKKLEDYAAASGANEPKTLHLVVDAGVEYGAVVRVLELARRKRITQVKFVVAQSNRGEANEAFALALSKEKQLDAMPQRPNPNYLGASLEKNGRYKLNVEEKTLDELTRLLPEIFKERETLGVFREGTNEIEKTVTIKAPLSAKYEEVARLIDAIKGTGAHPIVLQVDELEK